MDRRRGQAVSGRSHQPQRPLPSIHLLTRSRLTEGPRRRTRGEATRIPGRSRNRIRATNQGDRGEGGGVNQGRGRAA